MIKNKHRDSTSSIKSVKGNEIHRKSNAINDIINNIENDDKSLDESLNNDNKSILTTLPDDVNALQSIIIDLSNRLNNSQYTIESYKSINKQTIKQSNQYNKQLLYITNLYKLEYVKNIINERNNIKSNESNKYNNNKKLILKYHQDLRITMIDQEMNGSKLLLSKIKQMKDNINSLSILQDKQIKLLNYFNDYDNIYNLFINSIHDNNLYDVMKYIKSGVIINEIDSAGYLPIHYACSKGNIEIVKLLLDYGSDSTSYLTGINPAEVAVKYGHSHLLGLLIEYGCDINDSGTLGTSPLLTAVANNQIDCIIELLKFDVDINIIDSAGNSALHYATQLKDPMPIIKILADNGANDKLTNYLRFTPLKSAYAQANGQAIEMLGGRRGAMIASKDDNTKSPRDIKNDSSENKLYPEY